MLYITLIMVLLWKWAQYWEQRAEWLADIAIDSTSPYGVLIEAINDTWAAIQEAMIPAFAAISDTADALMYALTGGES